MKKNYSGGRYKLLYIIILALIFIMLVAITPKTAGKIVEADKQSQASKEAPAPKSDDEDDPAGELPY